jgi:hypothetical protein
VLKAGACRATLTLSGFQLCGDSSEFFGLAARVLALDFVDVSLGTLAERSFRISSRARAAAHAVDRRLESSDLAKRDEARFLRQFEAAWQAACGGNAGAADMEALTARLPDVLAAIPKQRQVHSSIAAAKLLKTEGRESFRRQLIQFPGGE